MVKIREGLPLLDGQTTQTDSATSAAKLVATQRSQQSANSFAQLPLDIQRQLATHKLHTTFDRSFHPAYYSHDPDLSAIYVSNGYLDNAMLQEANMISLDIETLDLDHTNIDVPAWLDKVAKRIGQESVPKLTMACELIRSRMNTHESERSGAYITGIGMTDILTYLYQDEDALVAAILYRSFFQFH